jgi:transcriptional repressor NrdR
LAPPSIKVHKRAGGSEVFDSQKIVRALSRVCKGRPQVDAADIERLARTIEAELLDERARSVSSGEVIRRVLGKLKSVDRVAHDRLAADYLDEDGHLRVDGAKADADDDAGQLGLFDGDD